MPKATTTTPKKGSATTSPKKAPATPGRKQVSEVKQEFARSWKETTRRERTPPRSGSRKAASESAVDDPVSAAASPPTNPALELYDRMRRSWEQVSGYIQNTYSESNKNSADSALSDFLQRRARDCLDAACLADSNVWHVSIAVKEADGQEISFPVLLIPQIVAESLIYPDLLHLPLLTFAESGGRVLSPARPGQDVLQLRHAFVVHACDLLVRPFGVVGKRVEYDLLRFKIKYIIQASDIDAHSVFSFLWAFSRAEKGRKADDKSGVDAVSSGTQDTAPSSSKLARARLNAKSGHKRSSAESSATQVRDALCPISLGRNNLVAAHLVHLRFGQPIYSWLMEGLIEENRLSRRYDLDAWANIRSWDINAQTNLVRVDPKLNMDDAWFLLPVVKGQSASLLPPTCLLKSSFWSNPEPADLEKNFIFVSLHNHPLSAFTGEFDIDINKLFYKNFTGISPLFVMNSDGYTADSRKRHKTAQSANDVDNEKTLAGALAASSTAATALTRDEILELTNRIRPAVQVEPAPRQSRPTSSESYWPVNPCYPPPVAWDAMAASRIMQFYRSLAVSCFNCIGNDELEILINALPPHARSQPQHGTACSDLDGGGGDTDSRDGDTSGQDKSSGRRAPQKASANDCQSSNGGDSSSIANGSSVGTVFLLSLMLLASQYAASNDDGSPSLVYSIDSYAESVKASDNEDHIGPFQERAEAQDLSKMARASGR